jgi:hypothetical protein
MVSCLWHPDAHPHGAIEVGGGGELEASPLSLAKPESEPTEAEMAVRHERSHTECLGQREGLMAMSFGQRARGEIAMCCDLPEEVSCIRLMAPFLVLPSEC